MHQANEVMVDPSVKVENAIIIQPSLVGKNVKIVNSIVGPNAFIAENCSIENSVVSNCMIQNNTNIKKANIDNAMIGSYVQYIGESKDLSIGDYTTVL
jgi:glucose-1-phosphate thymidylyltransferase